ncbi:hypothetical protein S83_064410 [Arachis hypogaea]
MRLGINGPWITKSYLEMILDKKRNAFLDADWSLVEKTRRNTFLPAKALQSLHQNQFVRLLTLLPDWRIFSAMDSVPQLIKWLFARKTSDKLSL